MSAEHSIHCASRRVGLDVACNCTPRLIIKVAEMADPYPGRVDEPVVCGQWWVAWGVMAMVAVLIVVAVAC